MGRLGVGDRQRIDEPYHDRVVGPEAAVREHLLGPPGVFGSLMAASER